MGTQIKLISKDTNVSELRMSKMPWDVVVNRVPYQVVRIEGYIHSIGGKWGDNDLWMYPRHTPPTYETLIEYSCPDCGVCWGLKYEPHNYIKTKWDETECYKSGGAMITRNGEDFYFCRGGIDEAKWIMAQLAEHPLNLNDYGFDEKMIGRKVWWRSEPAIITSWIGHGQACVILEPNGIEKFKTPAEFADECDLLYYEDGYVKTEIFDKHIWWFRDGD